MACDKDSMYLFKDATIDTLLQSSETKKDPAGRLRTSPTLFVSLFQRKNQFLNYIAREFREMGAVEQRSFAILAGGTPGCQESATC